MSESAESPPVWEFEQSVTAEADPQVAWDVWTDPAKLMELEGDAVESIELDGPFEAGTTGTTVQAGGQAVPWLITHADPCREATIEIALDNAVFRTHWRFEPAGNDQTRMTQRMELVGDNAAAFIDFMKVLEDNAPTGMLKLVAMIEKEAAAARTE